VTCGCPVMVHRPIVSAVARLRDDYDRGYMSRRDACSVTFAAIDAWASAAQRAQDRRKAESESLEEALRSMGALK
jgi:hypothetical protein